MQKDLESRNYSSKLTIITNFHIFSHKLMLRYQLILDYRQMHDRESVCLSEECLTLSRANQGVHEVAKCSQDGWTLRLHN